MVAAIAALIGRYRYQQAQLFQTASASLYSTRMSGGDDYDLDLAGPHYSRIGLNWAWDNPGGDWLDATQTRQGTTPWFTVNTNLTSGGSAVYEYSVDCTTALQFVQAQARWAAFIMRTTASRAIASPFSTTHPAPVINVTYVGGATAVLACTIVSRIDNSSFHPVSTWPEINLPAFIEFDRPTAAVSSATMVFTITQHWSGASVIDFFVVDPPVNAAATVTGIANGAALDAGLVGSTAHFGITPDVGNAGVIGVHRYLDGTDISQFSYSGPSYSAEENFDPAIFGRGATNLATYPHTGIGKYVNCYPSGDWSIVPSSYALEGFEPLAPGMGALRTTLRHESYVVDGFNTNDYGGTASTAKIFMPEPLFGNLDHIFVRQYIRIGTPGGQPYRFPMSQRYQTSQAPGTGWLWADAAGKFGLTPGHTTTDGGVSATSGGGYGWQSRMGWSDESSNDHGPDIGGWNIKWHGYDFAGNNPAGYSYSNYPIGANSGMGMFYADKWYCVEMELKLNTVMVDAPGYVPDGYLRFYIDGRLAWEMTGMVFRSLPLMDNSGPNPAYRSSYMRPCRTLGVTELWFDWFHGGMTQNTVPRTLFTTGVVWGTSYIGPMKLS